MINQKYTGLKKVHIINTLGMSIYKHFRKLG